MKCTTCLKRDTEHENTCLCASCDRDEWREATIRSNSRFLYAEEQLRRIHHVAGNYLIDNKLVSGYPCNYEDLHEVFLALNKE